MKLKKELAKAGKPCERCSGTGTVLRDPNMDANLVRGTCGHCSGSGLADYKARAKTVRPLPVDERPIIKAAE